ncbi:GrpB family protein [Rossellomorea sp. GCM10028870]|uniref:GrpB family protein n=1 Tax=Rossellomorea sp. GCM10028870 TaxID=3273426 RepID=UPI00261049F9|nr:GrpB family protein [uncultured Rossellomorea sp.]
MEELQGLMRDVKVVPHQSDWKEKFETEKRSLEKILPDSTIHHIGSTSVPGLAAKPIIDILIEVPDLESIDDRKEEFSQLDFVGKGENGIPNRRYFYKGEGNERAVHLHIFPYGIDHVIRHLAFRDYLREHETEARQYGELKSRLAKKFPHDMEGYIQGKDQFVKDLEKMAVNWYKKNKREGN